MPTKEKLKRRVNKKPVSKPLSKRTEKEKSDQPVDYLPLPEREGNFKMKHITGHGCEHKVSCKRCKTDFIADPSKNLNIKFYKGRFHYQCPNCSKQGPATR